MAASLLANEVSDLCLGKPALWSLSVTNTLADALALLKRLDDSYVSVWSCDHSSVSTPRKAEQGGGGGDVIEDYCRCIGKVCRVDIYCFLCKPENLSSPATALQSPISVLIGKRTGLVKHLEGNASLREAIDLMLEGVQNLVIPIQNRSSSGKRLLEKKSSAESTFHSYDRRYCWLTQEDIIRHLLNSIGLFSPTPGIPINSLGVIDTHNLLAVYYDDPASSVLELLTESLTLRSSVAIVDPQGKLIGEISPYLLNSSDEPVSAAIATLSAGDLMAYIDYGSPPEELVHLVKERLEERNLGAALELMGEDCGLSSWSSSSSISSDEEFCSTKQGKHGLGGYSARMIRRSEAIVCYPWSSLVSVMIRALSHRVSYVWVVEDDGSLSGIVSFTGMLKVFRGHLKSMGY